MFFPSRFTDRDIREFVGYSMTYNMDTQSVLLKSAGADPDLQWSGGSPLFINGQFVASLSGNATVDLSSTIVAPDIAGKYLLTGTILHMLVLTDASGNALVLQAGRTTLKIPKFNWKIWCPIAILKYVCPANTTFGTTSLTGAASTIYQLSNPIYPTYL